MGKTVERIQTLLQGSTLFDILDDKPDRLNTLKRLASAQEQADAEFYERQVKQRRGRLGGGTQEQVQNAVKNELYSNSQVNSQSFCLPLPVQCQKVKFRLFPYESTHPHANPFPPLLRLAYIARFNLRVHPGTRTRSRYGSSAQIAPVLRPQNGGRRTRPKDHRS